MKTKSIVNAIRKAGYTIEAKGAVGVRLDGEEWAQSTYTATAGSNFIEWTVTGFDPNVEAIHAGRTTDVPDPCSDYFPGWFPRTIKAAVAWLAEGAAEAAGTPDAITDRTEAVRENLAEIERDETYPMAERTEAGAAFDHVGGMLLRSTAEIEEALASAEATLDAITARRAAAEEAATAADIAAFLADIDSAVASLEIRLTAAAAEAAREGRTEDAGKLAGHSRWITRPDDADRRSLAARLKFAMEDLAAHDRRRRLESDAAAAPAEPEISSRIDADPEPTAEELEALASARAAISDAEAGYRRAGIDEIADRLCVAAGTLHFIGDNPTVYTLELYVRRSAAILSELAAAARVEQAAAGTTAPVEDTVELTPEGWFTADLVARFHGVTAEIEARSGEAFRAGKVEIGATLTNIARAIRTASASFAAGRISQHVAEGELSAALHRARRIGQDIGRLPEKTAAARVILPVAPLSCASPTSGTPAGDTGRESGSGLADHNREIIAALRAVEDAAASTRRAHCDAAARGEDMNAAGSALETSAELIAGYAAEIKRRAAELRRLSAERSARAANIGEIMFGIRTA